MQPTAYKPTASGPHGNLVVMVGRNIANVDNRSHTLNYHTGRPEDSGTAILGTATIQHVQEELFYMTKDFTKLKVNRHPKMTNF